MPPIIVNLNFMFCKNLESYIYDYIEYMCVYVLVHDMSYPRNIS